MRFHPVIPFLLILPLAAEDISRILAHYTGSAEQQRLCAGLIPHDDAVDVPLISEAAKSFRVALGLCEEASRLRRGTRCLVCRPGTRTRPNAA